MAFPSGKNVSEVKPRLGVCQFQQKMSIKNYAVLLSKVTALLLEPVRGFLAKQHIRIFFFFPCRLLAKVLCFELLFRFRGRKKLNFKEILQEFLPRGAFCMEGRCPWLTPGINIYLYMISNE